MLRFNLGETAQVEGLGDQVIRETERVWTCPEWDYSLKDVRDAAGWKKY